MHVLVYSLYPKDIQNWYKVHGVVVVVVVVVVIIGVWNGNFLYL